MIDVSKPNCPRCGVPIPENAPQGLCPKCVLENAETLATGDLSPKGKNKLPTLDELSPHFPELEVLELIGVGGMGAVYKARQPNLDRFVALKVLSQELSDDPTFTERFGREARVLGRLSHPNIVSVYDSGTKGPFAYLLMEYVDGVNLRQAMATGGFTPTEALKLVEDLCAALKFAHEKGILHRDIKPENVLIDSTGQVKIADFGIAKLMGVDDPRDVALTMTGSILGSPQYMAPEQIETPGDVDQRADIYSLGVVLYEMLTGELPLGRFAMPSEKARLDARIDEIVLRTLEKEREARFQSAEEVKTSVENVRTSPGSQTEPPLASETGDESEEGNPLASETSFFLSQLLPSSKFIFWCAILVIVILVFDVFSFVLLPDDSPDASGRIMQLGFASIILSTIAGILRGLHDFQLQRKRSDWKGDRLPKTFLRVTMLLSSFISLGVMIWVIIVLLSNPGDEDEASPTVTETGSAEKSETYQIADDQPRIDLDLSVAPGLVATFELVQTDAVGEEKLFYHHQGFILASDKEPWQGRVQLATIARSNDPPSSLGPEMLSSIHSDSADVISLKDELATVVQREWEWEKTEPHQLKFSEPGQHLFKVAYRSDKSETLSLRVEAQPREVPGIPKAALDHVKLGKAVCGLGEDTEWIRYLMEEIGKSPEGAEALATHREPEPDWQNGRPEKHANITIPAGMVATFELEGAGSKVYQRAHIVASDLEPWVGKVRIGTLAGGSRMQWRIEGPINTIKTEFEKPETWDLKPDAYTNTLDKTTTVYVTILGEIRSEDPSESKTEALALDIKVRRWKYAAAREGISEILPVPVMGLGDSDWIEDVKDALKITGQP